MNSTQKQRNFGMAYGAGAIVISSTGISHRRAKKLVKAFRAKFPLTKLESSMKNTVAIRTVQSKRAHMPASNGRVDIVRGKSFSTKSFDDLVKEKKNV